MVQSYAEMAQLSAGMEKLAGGLAYSAVTDSGPLASTCLDLGCRVPCLLPVMDASPTVMLTRGEQSVRIALDDLEVRLVSVYTVAWFCLIRK